MTWSLEVESIIHKKMFIAEVSEYESMMMYSNLQSADIPMKTTQKDSVEHTALVVWCMIALY